MGNATAGFHLRAFPAKVSRLRTRTRLPGKHVGTQRAATWSFSLEEVRRVFERSSLGRARGLVARRRPVVHHLLRATSPGTLSQPEVAGDAFAGNRGLR